jgi:hypothetical protein
MEISNKIKITQEDFKNLIKIQLESINCERYKILSPYIVMVDDEYKKDTNLILTVLFNIFEPINEN